MPPRKKLESEFASDLKAKLQDRLPGCFIYKMDPNQVQGIPDLLVLHEQNWALLETKRGSKGSDAAQQPNQDYYVEKMNDRSFSAFINPQNCDEVLDALQSAFRAEGQARIS